MIEILEYSKHKCISFFHLKRYAKFIESRKNSIHISDAYEKHHILPKAKDMFPELRNDRKNIIKLTPREHFIAHLMLAKAFGGSQIHAFVQMVNKKNNYKNKRSDIKVNSRSYENMKLKHINILSDNMKNTILVEDSLGYMFRVSSDDPRIRTGVLKIKNTGFINYSCYLDKSGNKIHVKHGEVIPDGLIHMNKNKACYVSVKDGSKVQLSVNDPRIKEGYFVAESSGRITSEATKIKLRECSTGYINIKFDDGRKLKILKSEIGSISEPYELNHGKGIKRQDTSNYKKSALLRKSATCFICGKTVKINLINRWHNDNCKKKENNE